MKIYFASAVTGNFGNKDSFAFMDFLEQFGEVVDRTAGWDGDDLHMSPEEIYQRDFAWLQSADVLIAEVSTKSLGVGYEIGRAIMMDKKILCLYRPSACPQLSPMIEGCDEIVIKKYEELPEAFAHIRAFLS